MKKRIFLILFLTGSLFLAQCGSSDKNQSKDSSETDTAETVDASEIRKEKKVDIVSETDTRVSEINAVLKPETLSRLVYKNPEAGKHWDYSNYDVWYNDAGKPMKIIETAGEGAYINTLSYYINDAGQIFYIEIDHDFDGNIYSQEKIYLYGNKIHQAFIRQKPEQDFDTQILGIDYEPNTEQETEQYQKFIFDLVKSTPERVKNSKARA